MDIQRVVRRNAVFMVLEGALFHAALSFIPNETVVAQFIDFTSGSVALVGLAATMISLAFYMGEFVCGLFVHRIIRQLPFMTKMAFLSRSMLMLFALLMLFGLRGPAAAWFFILTYFLVFFIDGFVGLCWTQMLARTLPLRKRGEVLSLQQSICGGIGVFVGFVLQRILTSALPKMDQFTLIFILSGVVFLVSAGTMLFFKDLPHPSAPDEPIKSPASYVRELAPLIIRNPGVRQTIFARILFTFTLISAPINYKFGQLSGLSEYQLSFLVYMPFAGQILAGIFWSRVSRRTNYPTMMMWGQLAGILCALLNFAAFACARMGVSVMVCLSAAMVLIKFTNVASNAFTQHVIAIVDERERANHIVLTSIVTAPATLGTTIAGAIADWAFWPVYAIMLLSGIAGALLTHRSFISQKSMLPPGQRHV
jgi:MFS family permease